MADAQQNGGRPVVVIVDDDPAIRSSLVFSLQIEGITGLAFVDGAEALKNASLSSAACFILDYKLPGMNGLDLLAELRRLHIAAPAILITTHPSVAVRERAVATGTVLIEKPLLGDALLHEIRFALGK
jgi:two-component system, LuxR family, response regulator FixJ